MEALAESARLLGDGGGTAIRAVDLESGEATALTEDVRETIRRILSPRYTSVGSVTGTLDTIGRRSGMYATVFEELHGRAVRCGFEEDLLSQVKEAFGQRVIARGIVHYNDETGVSRVDLRELEVLPDAERLPSVAQMYGLIPDFTGGLDSVEYVRQLRDE